MSQYIELFPEAGANFSANITLTDPQTNTTINIIPASFVFSGNVKRSHTGLNVATSLGFTKRANGVLSITLTAEQTLNLDGRYVFTVNKQNGSDFERVREGLMIVTPGT